MAHATARSAYDDLTDRLNRFPLGAPPSEHLERILRILFHEREAHLVSLLPIRPFTAEKAAKIWRTSPAEARAVLDELAGRGILVDVARDGDTFYVLPPPMAGFFEFSLMRLREDIDQKALAELFYEYLNVEEDFVRALFADGQTHLGRVFVHEPALRSLVTAPGGTELHVLDYERASEVIRTATDIGVGVCYCRHKMAHLGRSCEAPMNICMTFNTTAASLVRHGIARGIDAEECLDLLGEAHAYKLVQFGENARERVSFICNCCGCCCEAMIAARRFAFLDPVHTTNFLPATNGEECAGCGKCVAACPVEAMALVSANDPHARNRRVARLDVERCLGCGVCVRDCPHDAIRLEPRAERVFTPLNGTHRVIVDAIDRGMLQNLIFDNRVLWSHRALAAVVGAILTLGPVKRALASGQMRSRWLESLIGRMES